MRTATIERKTKETAITLTLNIDGEGRSDINTGVAFFDHMLDQVARHGLFDLEIRCDGDTHIDEHHSVEDVAICFGQALDRALGDRAGIVRAAHAFVPMDEALCFAAIDISGRPYAVVETDLTSERVGGLATDLVWHIFEIDRHSLAHYRPPAGALRPQRPPQNRGSVQSLRACFRRRHPRRRAAARRSSQHQRRAMTGRAEQARARLARSLPAALQTLLDIAVDVAREAGLALYLVGGPVRDALMSRPVSDLDLVVEGDAWPAAEAFARAAGGRITRHERFRTAVVEAPDAGWSVDWVTARRERYPAPAALPEVEPAPIVEDLARRDFSINALALRLDRAELLDPFGGEADIRHSSIRVLHDASFVDDPTRLLRAARFAARWEFELEAHTLELARDAVAGDMIARTSPQRILHELWLTLDEPKPERVFARLNEWGAMPQLALEWSDELADRLAAARVSAPGGAESSEVYLALLIAAINQREREQLKRRYNLPAAALRMLRTLPAEPPRELQTAPADATTLEALLVRYTLAELRALELMSSPAGKANIRRYVDQIRRLPPLLTGDDLKAAGLAPGPLYAEILAEARRKQLEGTLRDAGDARVWLARWTQEMG